MSRESADEKGRRYLTEGRLTLEHVDAGFVHATCRGGGAVYVLGWNGDAWWCGCAARGRCSHLVALQLVVVRDRGDVGEADRDADEPRLSSAAFEDDDPEPRLAL